ncbi:restriction endonuclease subunit S [Priestia megaterium]|uniref:restriction endonuclease subunit S n=1 Tax=Priestia megaterium TaxID=1404 RepID=UPI0024691430|nr:restriction endonuclease subunit S [Priestia megaterium]
MNNIQHWKNVKLKYLADMRSGESITSEVIEPSGLYPVYGGGALRGYTSEYTHKGKYVLIGRQGANCGNVKTVQGEFWASEHAVVVTPNSNVDVEWLGYLLESMNLNQYSMSAAQPGLAVSMIKNLEALVPPKKTQEKITKYINSKVSSIEELIKQKEKLIILIQEKRQSVITEVVTKGLDSNVIMKDSGVEWIGEIPDHWEIKKIRYTTYAKGRIGWQGLKSEEFIDEGPYLVTGTDFNRGKVDWEKCYHITEERYMEAPEIQLQEGDLLITKDGTIGKLALIENLPGKASLNSHLLVLRPLRDLYSTKYLYWYLSSDIFTKYVELKKTGTTFYGISQDSIERFLFALPSIKEQNQITNFLDKQTELLDSVKFKLQDQIKKLQEYRQSLIYEAVTGEIDAHNVEVVL